MKFFILFLSTLLYSASFDTQWSSLFHNNTIMKEAYLSGEMNLTKELAYEKTHLSQENICSYPARYSLIKKEYPDLNISFDSCSDLNQFIKDSNASKSSIVFASSYLSSPSSFFGHGFLLLKKESNPFFSQTISYSAEVPAEKSGFFSMIYSGTSGDFKGTINVAPYFKLIESYNQQEQRNLEEYETTLSSSENYLIMLHSYELLLLKNKYKFFSNNCATELLWILNVGRPGIIDFKQKFDTPYSVIKVASKAGILKGTVLERKSLLNKINEKYFSMSLAERRAFIQFKESSSKQDLNVSDNIIELTNMVYDFQFKKFSKVEEDYNFVKHYSLNLKNDVPAEHPFNLKNESKVILDVSNTTTLSFQPALMDRQFDQNDISQINLKFFDIGIEKQGLNHLNIVDISAYNYYLPFKKDLSWKLFSGFEKDSQNNLFFNNSLLLGLTFGNKSFSGYFLTGGTLNTDKNDILFLSGISSWYQNFHFDYERQRSLNTELFDKDMVTLSFNMTDYSLFCKYDFTKENFHFGYVFKF